MNNLYSYPDNDYRNYLKHWGKGKEAKDHKYISRKRGKDGNWVYTYASKLTSKAKNALDSLRKDDSVEEVETTNVSSERGTEKPSGFLSGLTSLLSKKTVSKSNSNKTISSKFSSLKSKLTSTLKKPLISLKPKKSLSSIVNSLKKSNKKVSSALKKPISSIKNPLKSATASLKKSGTKFAKASKALSKPISSATSKLKSKLHKNSKSKVNGNPNDPRAPHDPSMDHSDSNKSELVTYLASIGIHKLTMNYPALQRDVVRAAKFAEAPIRKKIVDSNRSKSTERDKESGLLLKHSDMSKREDMFMVNPEYKNFDANTKNNCMLCTTAYDLRRRGYDVSANKASWGYDAEDATRWYKNAEVKEAAERTRFDEATTKKYLNDTVKALESQGEGARGNLMVQWISGGGHSIAYEVENGKVVLYDCQTNTVYKDPNKVLQNTWYAQYMRTDNLEVDFDYVREAVNDNSSSSRRKRR